MRLLLVNTVASGGSIGSYINRIAAHALSLGWEVAVAAGGGAPADPRVKFIRIGSRADMIVSALATRLFDSHGLTGAAATRRFCSEADAFCPDIVHLHNIHGYYLHYPALFRWLAERKHRVLWTLHDCWAFTGHCASFDRVRCMEWTTGCHDCPLGRDYPATRLISQTARNYAVKRAVFTSVPGLRLLPVSDWLKERVLPMSFLGSLNATTVKIDVDLDTYCPSVRPSPTPVVLGVANVWTSGKSLQFFRRLRDELPPRVRIRIAGDIRGANRIGGVEYIGWLSPDKLAAEYAGASVFVNPTYAESYSMTNREALACGTPVVTRAVGGATEDLLDGSGALRASADDSTLIAMTKDIIALPAEPLRTAAVCLARRLYGNQPFLRRLFDIYSF